MRGHDRHIILPQRAYRFSITEPRFKRRFLRGVFEGVKSVRNEASVEPLRALVPIERRRACVYPLKDHREASCFDRPPRSAHHGDHHGDHIVHRRSMVNRSPFTRADDSVRDLDREEDSREEDARSIASRREDSDFTTVRRQVSRVSCR